MTDSAPLQLPEDDRWILMIETSQRQGSVALGTVGGDLIEELPFSPGLVHGKELLPRIDELVSKHGTRSQLGMVAVSRGPGSFTGIRIGVAAAKAIGWGLGIPTIGLSSLECMIHGLGPDSSGRWAAILDASGGDRDLGIYQVDDQSIEIIEDERAVRVEDLPTLIEAGTGVVGSGCRDVDWSKEVFVAPIDKDQPPASSGLVLARRKLELLRSGSASEESWNNPHQLQPRYLRVSRAEEVRRKKLAEQGRQ
ncbi:MAG: tRNA (adenosine(37)-N6)-threonylcarbamoyltransferase complex dimerization subunit type 1 TsaB [Planctomycetia bacterium TMED53]|nr:MAG: tRNA (adenosine(37)-N6)-threonylcarbamoyltransferase complex dimerization subunit type 1 TsaB [Planctomycetia bacterium TMED53]